VRRGPDSEQKWGILKYLSAEFFSERSETIQDQRTHVSGILGQKMGYDTWLYDLVNLCIGEIW